MFSIFCNVTRFTSFTTVILGERDIPLEQLERMISAKISLLKVGTQNKKGCHNGSPKLSNLVVARDGVEPPTRGFSVRCSTN
jgi:hypothetical protein